MYMFIQMSSKWYCKENISLFTESPNIEAHVANGEMVILTDDMEEFCSTMGVNEEDIEMV